MPVWPFISLCCIVKLVITKETVGEGDGKEEEAENVQEPLLELVELSGYFRFGQKD